MKRITGPIDGLTLLLRAVTFANMPHGTDPQTVCRKLHVLPPGAPYLISQRGDVFAAPRRKRDFTKLVATAHDLLLRILQDVAKGRVPELAKEPKREIGPTRMEIDDPDSHTGKTTVIDVAATEFTGVITLDFRLPSLRWFRVQGFHKARVLEGEELIIPTLDGLVAAGTLALFEHRKHVRRCKICTRYFIRGDRKAATCGLEVCKRKHVREKNARGQAARRQRLREMKWMQNS